jgi:hypothetical protein
MFEQILSSPAAGDYAHEGLDLPYPCHLSGRKCHIVRCDEPGAAANSASIRRNQLAYDARAAALGKRSGARDAPAASA